MLYFQEYYRDEITFERAPKAFPQEKVQTVKDFVTGKPHIEQLESICLELIEWKVEESIKYSRQKIITFLK